MSKNSSSFETLFANTNAGYFLREFSFRRTEFCPSGGTELELADHILLLGPLFMVFQLKAREQPSEDPVRERTWFDKKVVQKGTKQIRDTLRYLAEHRIEVENDRGHRVRLPDAVDAHSPSIMKVVVYDAAPSLPPDCFGKHFHTSAVAGFIHLIAAQDWLGILQTLVTPAEIGAYLEFRARLCSMYPVESSQVSERALVGHYISEQEMVAPSPGAEEVFATLVNDLEAFDISPILHQLPEKKQAQPVGAVTPSAMDAASRDHYPLLQALALLPRSELRLFKERFMICWDRCGGDDPFITRFVATSSGAGFLFLAAPRGWEKGVLNGLQNLTLAHKHEQRLTCCIGASFVRDGEHLIVNWLMVEYSWEPDPEMDARLADFNPLPELHVRSIPRYSFRQ